MSGGACLGGVARGEISLVLGGLGNFDTRTILSIALINIFTRLPRCHARDLQAEKKRLVVYRARFVFV